jgi:hypothetical protein
MKRIPVLLATLAFGATALAGPPFATDDAEPTGPGHYEIYFFAQGAHAAAGHDGAAGVDFNYGAAPDLQLTAVLPWVWDAAHGESAEGGWGNVELAAKYRVAHQEQDGVDAAFFPRVFLPAGDGRVAETHASLLLPLWVQRRWNDTWTTFGGGGCEIHRGGDSRDFCMAGIALTAQVGERLQLGAELYHQTSDTRGGRTSTDIGLGATWDINAHAHLMASAGPGLQNTRSEDRTVWYAALLWTL